MNKLIKFITAVAMTGVVATANAGNAPDTVVRLRRAESVVVVTDGTTSTITVDVKANGTRPPFVYTHKTQVTETSGDEPDEGMNFDIDRLPDLPFVQNKKRNARRHFGMYYGRDLYIGALIPVANDAGFTTCWECGISQVVGGYWCPAKGGPSFNLGFGIGFRELKLTGGYLFGSEGDGILTIEPLAEGLARAKTRLYMCVLQMPLTIRQHLHGDFVIELGATLTCNSYTKASSDYRTDDNQYRYKQEFKHLHQRNFGVDLRLGFGWAGDFGFYVRYAPVSIFAKNLGPQTDLLSAGISVGF